MERSRTRPDLSVLSVHVLRGDAFAVGHPDRGEQRAILQVFHGAVGEQNAAAHVDLSQAQRATGQEMHRQICHLGNNRSDSIRAAES